MCNCATMNYKLGFVVLAAVLALGSASLVGGFRNLTAEDEGVQNALKFAVAKHNSGLNDMYLSQVTDVVHAKSKVVSGLQYVITVNMAKTNCSKNNVTEVCGVHSDPALARPYQCTFTVWTRSWMNFIELTSQKCN